MVVMRGEPWLVLGALALEACIGYPEWLYKRIRHPVVWIGAIIGALSTQWNDGALSDARRLALGVTASTIIVGSATAVALAAEHWLTGTIGIASTVLIATSGLAQRSLHAHTLDVLRALQAEDLAAARVLVSRIVGRDTAQLTHEQVAAAALESLAESFNDAVVAPAFWLFVGGLPGLFAYKAANTADSMMGHMEPRWRMFGWASARLDDVLNFIPARIAGLLIAVGARGGIAVMLRDARKHASPNAGWPEAALAGGLALRLGGPVFYDGVPHDRPSLGDGRSPTSADLHNGLAVFRKACVCLWATLACLGVIGCWLERM
jgi:adenosylcobinamide-phosphate synthase